MATTIKNIIFDYGNVLVQWDPRAIYRRYFPDDPQGMETFFDEVRFLEWNALQDQGRTFREGVADLSRQFPHRAGLIQAYHDHWKDSLGDPLTGTVEILHELKSAGYPLYGLSNWSAETFPYARERYDFFDLFDDMVVSGYVGLVKPDPKIFELLLKKIGAPAQDCLFIDDSFPNIQQASRLGFAVIHFISSGQLRDELTRQGIL